jgi:hypothetical protein
MVSAGPVAVAAQAYTLPEQQQQEYADILVSLPLACTRIHCSSHGIGWKQHCWGLRGMAACWQPRRPPKAVRFGSYRAELSCPNKQVELRWIVVPQ